MPLRTAGGTGTVLFLLARLPAWAGSPATAPQPGADASGDPLPSGIVRRLGTNRLCHGNPTGGLVFSPDGRFLLSWDESGFPLSKDLFCLWDNATGKAVCRFGGNAFLIEGAAFSADGKLLACADRGGDVRLWEVPSGKLRHELRGHGGKAACVCFARAASLLASAGRDDTVRFWDPATGKEIHRLPLPKGIGLTGIALSPDGTRLITAEPTWTDSTRLTAADADWVVRIREVKTGKELSHCAANKGWGHLSPDGKMLAVATERAVHLWDAVAGEERFRLPFSQAWAPSFGGVAFSADGTTLATVAVKENRIRVWSTATGKECSRLPLREAVCFGLSWDGKLVASATIPGMIRIWDVAVEKERLPLVRHDGPAEQLAYSPDGKALASRARSGSTIVWDMQTGKPIRDSNISGWSEGCFTFVPDCRTLAVADGDELLLYDVATGKPFPPLEGHKGAVNHVSVSAEGKVLASAGADGTIRLWDLVTQKQVLSMRCPDGKGVIAVAFAPKGTHLASSGEDGTIRLWDAATGKPVRVIARGPRLRWPSGVRHEPTVLLFSPDSGILAGIADGELYLWDVVSGRRLTHFPGEELFGTTLSFSPDGKLLAAVGCNPSLCLWEIASGHKLLELPSPHVWWFSSVAVSPDGKTLAWSGGPEEAILIGDIASLLGDGRPPPPATPREIPKLWDALGGEDAAEAYRAIERLAAAPREVVPFIQAHLLPIVPVDPGRLARLLADLDHDEFAVRERATEGLRRMGEQAGAGLRRVLERKPSPEMEKRVRALLEKLEPEPRLRLAVRSTILLERLGSPEARRLLQQLAEGAPEARLTREAQASLGRLDKGPAREP